MAQIAMVGFSEGYLTAVDNELEPNSVVVLEEPDIVRKRDLAGKAQVLNCLAEIVPAQYQQTRNFLKAGYRAHQARGFQAVIPGHEYAVPGAAALAALLGLPGASEKAAVILRDKLRLREVTNRAGVRNPRWTEVRSPADIVDFARGGPVVVKPADRQASLGVHLLDHAGPAEVAEVWRSMTEAEEHELVPARRLLRRYLVEERMSGPEYSVEALVREREVIFENVTEKAVVPGTRPIEVGHLVPAPMSRPARGLLAQSMRTLIDATGFITGILHAEWILTADGPALVECAGRCPGDRVTDLIDLAYGMHMRTSLIELLSGGSPTMPGRACRAAAIRFLSAAPGRVLRVDGADLTSTLPGVQELHMNTTIGSVTKTWTSSWDRPGYVVVTGEDPGQAQARAIQAASSVHIVTV